MVIFCVISLLCGGTIWNQSSSSFKRKGKKQPTKQIRFNSRKILSFFTEMAVNYLPIKLILWSTLFFNDKNI